jgi:uncharacterized protein YidB (DUF937 family)
MIALLVAALQSGAPPASPPATPRTRFTAESESVRARLACKPLRESAVFCAPERLEIDRGGKLEFTERFSGKSSFVEGAPARGPLAVRDLTGDGEPEVLLDLYSGGAHCCSSTRIYYRIGGPHRYGVRTHDWGNDGYRLEDLDGDGRFEFVSGDDRFSYAFASYAASHRPPQIWRFSDGGLSDVTRQYPKRIEEDAGACWKAFDELSPKDPSGDIVRGVLAAYVADQCLLGRCPEGWARLRAAYDKPDRDEFFSQLEAFLRKNAYSASEPASHRMEAAMGTLDGILGALSGLVGDQSAAGPGQAAPTGGSLMSTALQLLQQNGGIPGVLAKFQQAGLAKEAQSWVSTGSNLPISGDQLQKVLGSGLIGQIASQLGLSHGEAGQQLASLLPQVIDKMTPQGTVGTDHGDLLSKGLAMLQGMTRQA